MILKIACVIVLITMKIEEFNLDNSLIDEKSYKNILIYSVSNKTLIDANSLCISFDEKDGITWK